MSRAEAERLLGLAEKLLQSRDLNGTKDFAVLAQETEPLLDGPDQILAVADVLLASDKRLPSSSPDATLPDWYSLLQVPRRSDDPDLIKKQYRRLALLLHPDKNKYPLADRAFQLVSDAWAVLSDPAQKAQYDSNLGPFSRVDLPNSSSSSKLPVRRSPRPSKSAAAKPSAAARNGNNDTNVVHNNNNDSTRNRGNRRWNENDAGPSAGVASFWTVCPYCYMLFEYPRVYEDCCLKCQSCERAFHGAVITSMPPLVPGKEAYYCSWGFFPLGFTFKGMEGNNPEFPAWMPPVFGNGQQRESGARAGPAPARVQTQPQPQVRVQPQPAVAAPVAEHNRGGRGGSGPAPGKRKRGRPRKYPPRA